MQSLAVFTDAGDTLSIAPADTLELTLDGPFARGLVAESDNLVLRAARALDAKKGASITLTKNLPVASGIGGGSADAAAALRGLRALWDRADDDTKLCEIAAMLGSDIPVCVGSTPAFMEGRGEILTPVSALPRLPMLLVNPGVAVPTKDVFSALQSRSGVDTALPRGLFGDTADLLRFLETTHNDLEAPARAIQPVIGDVLDGLAACPGALFIRMSGSGATCFGIFADDACCVRAANTLRDTHANWWIAPTFVPAIGIVQETQGQDIGPTPDGL